MTVIDFSRPLEAIASNAVASGGTATITIPFGPNRTILVKATCLGKYNAGGFGAVTDAIFERGAGASSLTTGCAGIGNPSLTASNLYAASGPFCNGGVAGVNPSTVVWSAVGNDAVLTITNNGAGVNDFETWIEIFNIG